MQEFASQLLSTISYPELQTLIETSVKNAVTEHLKLPQKEKAEEIYLTAKEVEDILGITHATRHKWTMSGIIPGYRISSLLRYKKSEIEKALKPIKSAKA